MIKSILFATLLLVFSQFVLGQNLIINPSLELYSHNVVGWKIVAGTPDIASQNDQIKAKDPFFNPIIVPDGHPQKLGGIVFGEICICQGFNSHLSEVTQVELSEPLKRKENYEISLYVIKSSIVDQAISEVSVALTRRELKASANPFSYQVPYLSLRSEVRPQILSKDEWVRVQAVYTAKGGEKYLTIGNFKGANREELAKLKGPYQSTYYCYDNVSVVPLALAEAEPAVVPITRAMLAKAAAPAPEELTLQDASFAFGRHTLQEAAFPMLDRLASFLNENPTVAAIITGYTDDVGKEEENKKLSERRAMAVKEYIISKGIAAERITAQGLGELKPKASNLTKEGRAINRRVEIELVTD